jgi:diguanylate cyclase (GGDEF)-like protein/PAS domain S-box-containing protein
MGHLPSSCGCVTLGYDGASVACPIEGWSHMSVSVGEAVGGRFAPTELIKSGNGVETHLGCDLVNGDLVIIKSVRLSRVPIAGRLRFEHEARVLSELADAGLRPVLDVGRDGDQLYLVQPYVAGRSLQHEVEEAGPLAVEALLRMAIDVADALEAAHAVGVIHRDVKPANIVLGSDGSATLIDFGFARSIWLDESIRDEMVGTVRYLAPEVAGLLETAVDARSDLYSLGAVIVEAATGQPPFPGPGVGELLRQHLSMPVPDLVAPNGRPLPRALTAVVQRLLRKDPAERYQTASAVSSDMRLIAERLSAGDRDPVLVIGRTDRRDSLTEPAFVGRDHELSLFSRALAAVEKGRGGALVVEAESGGGKSRLLGEWIRAAESNGAMVLRGQGAARVAQRPFLLLDGVVRDLMSQAGADTRERVERALGESLGAVAAALPTLAEGFGWSVDSQVGPEEYGEQRSVAALVTLLDALGHPDRPAVVVLDDCQWSDTLTTRLLLRWAESLNGHPCHVLVVVAYRSEEVGGEHPLRQLGPLAVASLGPLGPAAMRELAESMAGPLPAEAHAVLGRLADGSPFMAGAVLRGLLECGALVAQAGGGWGIDHDALRDVQAARRSGAVLVRRLELLSSDALALLTAGSVLGKQFDLDPVIALADVSSSAASQALDEASRRRLVWLDERTGRCSFAHDKIREALLDRLDAADRRRLHSRAADILAGTDASAYELAYHLDAAGRFAEALPHALAAAEDARAQHSLDVAAAHYRMARRGIAMDDTATKARIAEGLADVLTLEGAYADAREELELASSFVTENIHAAELERKLGDVAFKQADLKVARAHLEGALGRLGNPVPRSTFGFLIQMVREVLVQIAHTALPKVFCGRRSPEGKEAELLAIRIYSRLAYLYWFHSGIINCGWAHFREMNLAERYPPSAELGQAYSEHAPVATMLPWFSRGIRYVQRSLRIREQLGDVWGQGQSLHFYGVVLYGASRYTEAIDRCREAIALLDRTGDRWESNTAGWHVALSLYRLGDLAGAASVGEAVFRSADAIGDEASSGIAFSAWTRGAQGLVPHELVEAQLAKPTDDAHTASEVRVAAMLRALADGDLTSALKHISDARQIVRSKGLRQEYVAPVPAWEATVLRMIAESTAPLSPRLRRQRLRGAARAARRAHRLALAYRNNLPHALRELGLVAALRGRERRARRLLQRSISVAENQLARREADLSREALSQLGDRSIGPRMTPEVMETAAIEQGAPRPLMGLVDRFSTLLRVGRDLTSATSADGVHAGIREAALTLLRGERCHLVVVDGDLDERLVTVSGESVDELSRTLIRRAVEAGEPVAVGDLSAAESESLLLSGLRSVLAAPVTVHGEVTMVFYVTHREIGYLFGDEEVQLATFIATLAGAALEHVAGSEARFHSLAQNSSDVMTLVDAAGTMLFQSSAALRVFGQSPSDWVGRPILDWVHPADAPAFQAVLDAVTAREVAEGTRIECRVLHADGSWRHAETAVSNLLGESNIRALVLNTRDVTERRRLEDELRERALHDPLTGLANRALFLDRVKHARAQRRDGRARPAVMFLDLDDFKSVNDTLGHAVGDALLIAVGERIALCLRPGDTVARLGGDEFAVLVDEGHPDAVTLVADRILEATGRPVSLSGTEMLVHASIGIVHDTDESLSADDLLARADAAMYSAKARGKHRHEVFEPEMQHAAQTRGRLRTELDRALGQSEFLLHYQPIIDLGSERAMGCEALVRWQHPARGLVPPGEFIDLAEESGLVVPIGRWVLQQAVRDAMLMQTSCPGMHVAVNVSARQLQDPTLVSDVESVLLEHGLPPECLLLEITESATVGDGDAAVARLHELKSLGIKLALDDFGTGYSSLTYLRRFPVDYVKIDRSFVAELGTNAQNFSIVRGVIELAHALGIKTIAEGVETRDQLVALRALDCDQGQGFHWTHAVPQAELVARMLPRPRISSEHVAPRH